VEENTIPGFDEIDAAVSGSVERIREIIADAGYLSLNGDKRIVILDEAHRLNSQAQDVLLKALEDRILVALFCTTEPEKIRPAIRSRLEEYHVKPPSLGDLVSFGRDLCAKEGISCDEELLPNFVDRCGFCPRVVAANLALLQDLGGLNRSNFQLVFDNNLADSVIEFIRVFEDKPERIRLMSEITTAHNSKTFLKELVNVVSLVKRIGYNIPVSYVVSLKTVVISRALEDFIFDCLSFPDINETALTFAVTKDYKKEALVVTAPSGEESSPTPSKRKSINKIIEIDGIKYNSQEKLTSLDDKIETSSGPEQVDPIENPVEFINLKVPMTEREFGREYIRRIKA